jgi:hypothetical protein
MMTSPRIGARGAVTLAAKTGESGADNRTAEPRIRRTGFMGAFTF